MSGSVADLTDKEKEALSLLLAGHDAKSSAAQLDLSVHTINDRLRNARRKLGVSSSREAARILGVAEGADPQKPAHTSFGIAPGGAQLDNADLNHTEPKGPFGLTWLAGGMLIMSIAIAAAIIGVVYMSNDGASSAKVAPGPDTASTSQDAPAEAESLPRAERFLNFVDAGDWDGSWDAAGAYFQSQVSEAEWAETVEPVRQPLGAVKERKLVTVQRASTLPNAPEGDYEVLQFQTDFAGRDKQALETVVMLIGEDGWEVVGYFVL